MKRPAPVALVSACETVKAPCVRVRCTPCDRGVASCCAPLRCAMSLPNVPTIVVCMPCRVGKRKCDGRVPCSRCLARGGAVDCVMPQPKRRGRPPRAREAGVTDVAEPVPDTQSTKRRTSDALVQGDVAREVVNSHAAAADALVEFAVAESQLGVADERDTPLAAPPIGDKKLKQLIPDMDALRALLLQANSSVTIVHPRDLGTQPGAAVARARATCRFFVVTLLSFALRSHGHGHTDAA